MSPYTALCVWTLIVMLGSFYLGRRGGWLDERYRCHKIASDAADFCKAAAASGPRDEYTHAWEVRADEADQIAEKIQSSTVEGKP